MLTPIRHAHPLGVTVEQAVERRNRKDTRLCLLVPSGFSDTAVSSLGNSFSIFDLASFFRVEATRMAGELGEPGGWFRASLRDCAPGTRSKLRMNTGPTTSRPLSRSEAPFDGIGPMEGGSDSGCRRRLRAPVCQRIACVPRSSPARSDHIRPRTRGSMTSASSPEHHVTPSLVPRPTQTSGLASLAARLSFAGKRWQD